MNTLIVKNSLIKKLSKSYPLFIGLGILGIMVVHFAFQMNFIQTERFQSVETVVQTENAETEQTTDKVTEIIPQIINIAPEVYEVQKVKIITIPEKVAPEPRRQVESAAAAKIPVKKKAERKTEDDSETEKERLRRAEKLLTGF